MVRRTLTGLPPQVYEHPLDAKTLNALHNTVGFETLIRKLNKWGFDQLLRVQLAGSNLRVTADNFPAIYDSMTEAIAILDVPIVPDIYIAASGQINALTCGVDRPIIVLTSYAVDSFTKEELQFVIAHELGHIKSGHVLYSQIANFMPMIAGIVGGFTLGVSEIFCTGVHIALLNWQRMAEFTADRAGLLVCQDANIAIGAMMKIAGLPRSLDNAANTADFIAQAREFMALDTDKLSWIVKGLSVMGQDHPWTVMRANQFLAWIDSGDYEAVLGRTYDKRAIADAAMTGCRYCHQCGRPLKGPEAFCANCGTRVPGSPASAGQVGCR